MVCGVKNWDYYIIKILGHAQTMWLRVMSFRCNRHRGSKTSFVHTEQPQTRLDEPKQLITMVLINIEKSVLYFIKKPIWVTDWKKIGVTLNGQSKQCILNFHIQVDNKLYGKWHCHWWRFVILLFYKLTINLYSTLSSTPSVSTAPHFKVMLHIICKLILWLTAHNQTCVFLTEFKTMSTLLSFEFCLIAYYRDINLIFTKEDNYDDVHNYDLK